ncbi:hypothetical protein [Ruegeria sp.]|uniref:hypothetical protein n=1 Tax=Ruegeria sp. TaxID=1879320 RepID=UPI003B5BB1AD
MSNLTNKPATIDQELFKQDLLVLLDKYAGSLSGQEVLALSSHVVGQLLACQNPEELTLVDAFRIINANIASGNEAARAEIQKGGLH